MTAPRLTVVGHCTSTTARILCAVDRMPDAQRRVARLAWRAAGAAAIVEVELANAPPYELALFDLRDLPPGAEIEYGIAVGEAPPAERILAAGTRRFRLLSADRPPRVALLSCNGVYEFKDQARRYDMWRRLIQQINDGNVDLVIHAGDQVYADEVVKRYTKMARTAKDGEALLATLTEESRRCRPSSPPPPRSCAGRRSPSPMHPTCATAGCRKAIAANAKS